MFLARVVNLAFWRDVERGRDPANHARGQNEGCHPRVAQKLAARHMLALLGAAFPGVQRSSAAAGGHGQRLAMDGSPEELPDLASQDWTLRDQKECGPGHRGATTQPLKSVILAKEMVRNLVILQIDAPIVVEMEK